MPHAQFLRRLVAILAIIVAAAPATAGDRIAAELLPPTTVIFAEIREPEELLKAVYDHHLVQSFQSLDEVRSAMASKKYLEFLAGVAIVESQMGLTWRDIVGQASGGGIAVATDATTRGVAVLARATDEATQSKFVETLANLARLDANNKGNPDPLKTSDYRGIKIYDVDKTMVAVAADWFVATTSDELGKQIIDRILDPPQESLAGDAQFAKARDAIGAATAVWGYVNTAAIRDVGWAKEAFAGQAENPGVELILGGILSTLQKTPYVTVGLELSDQELRLAALAPHDRSWAGDSREHYFGPMGKGAAPPRLAVDETILSLCTYRDISAMWLRAGDLFDEKANEELAKADSGLSTLFSGKDFGEDILGSLQPEIQVFVARQEFAEGQPTPAISLPAFALVSELKDPAAMQPELRRTFQNLIGFFNVIGAMNGQPQLELDMEKTDAAQFVTATHLPDPSSKDPHAQRINYNFSPTVAFAGSRFVLASTSALAHTLAAASPQSSPPDGADRIVNTDLVLNFDALRAILTDNRGQLVAQNMLSEGHAKDEAEKAIGALLEIVGWFDRLKVSLNTTPSELQATLEVGIKEGD